MILVGVVLALILVVNFIPDTVEDSGMMLAPSFERSLGDIQKELFEGDTIVTSLTDHGQSALTSGPFANSQK